LITFSVLSAYSYYGYYGYGDGNATITGCVQDLNAKTIPTSSM
jgi:hypothetical protein